MIIKKTTYQTISIVISLIYMNFFVLSPFFHHHHPEKELVNTQSEIIYSSVVNDCCEVDCDEFTEHHLEDCSDNSHNPEECHANNVFMTRSIQPNLKVDSDSSLNIVIKDDHETLFENPTNEDFFLLQWEKLVHSASNISPPTA